MIANILDKINSLNDPDLEIKVGNSTVFSRQKARGLSLQMEIDKLTSRYPGQVLTVMVYNIVDNRSVGVFEYHLNTMETITPQGMQTGMNGLGNNQNLQPMGGGVMMTIADVLELTSLKSQVPGMTARIQELIEELRNTKNQISKIADDRDLQIKTLTAENQKLQVQLDSYDKKKELEMQIAALNSTQAQKGLAGIGLDLKDEGSRSFIMDVVGMLKPDKAASGPDGQILQGLDTQTKKDLVRSVIEEAKKRPEPELLKLSVVLNELLEKPADLDSLYNQITEARKTAVGDALEFN